MFLSHAKVLSKFGGTIDLVEVENVLMVREKVFFRRNCKNVGTTTNPTSFPLGALPFHFKPTNEGYHKGYEGMGMLRGNAEGDIMEGLGEEIKKPSPQYKAVRA